jgi:uncharacterized membrane protein YbhN (UPF0104 family)
VSTTSRGFPLRAAVSLTVVAALAAGFFYALPRLRLGEVLVSLRHTSVVPLAGAALAALSMHALRAAFWRVALVGTKTVPLLRLIRYTILGAASSALLPARAGEAVRVWLLADLEQIPAVTGVGTALAERALDVASMVLVLAPLPWLLPDAPLWVTRALSILTGVGASIFVAVIVLARNSDRFAGDGLLSRLARAMSGLSHPGRFLLGLAALVGAWLVDIAALLLVARALGMTLPPAAPLLVLLSVNLAIAVPAAPAQLGSHEAGTLVALGLLGVPTSEAVAFALLYHAAHVLPLLAAAALDAPLLVRASRRRGAERASAE